MTDVRNALRRRRHGWRRGDGVGLHLPLASPVGGAALDRAGGGRGGHATRRRRGVRSTPEMVDFARRLRPGDEVDVTYTEAAAVRVEPANR